MRDAAIEEMKAEFEKQKQALVDEFNVRWTLLLVLLPLLLSVRSPLAARALSLCLTCAAGEAQRDERGHAAVQAEHCRRRHGARRAAHGAGRSGASEYRVGHHLAPLPHGHRN